MNKETQNNNAQTQEQSPEETIKYLEAYITSLVNYNQELVVQLVDLRTQLTIMNAERGEQ